MANASSSSLQVTWKYFNGIAPAKASWIAVSITSERRVSVLGIEE